MDPDSVKSTLSNLAFGNVIAAAARDLQKVTDFSPNIPAPPYAAALPQLCLLYRNWIAEFD